MKNKPLASVNNTYTAIKNIAKISASLSAMAVLASCASPSMSMPGAAELLATLKSSFSERGPAKMDRLDQNEVQRICTEADKTGKAVNEETRKKIETALYSGIPYPTDAKYIGNWQEGEKLRKMALVCNIQMLLANQVVQTAMHAIKLHPKKLALAT